MPRSSRSTGEDAAVLLKNEGGALPLKSADLDQLSSSAPPPARSTPSASMASALSALPERQVGPYDALKRSPATPKIGFAVDDDMTGTTIPAISSATTASRAWFAPATAPRQVDASHRLHSQGRQSASRRTPLSPGKARLRFRAPGTYWIYLQALGTNAAIKLDGKRFAATGVIPGRRPRRHPSGQPGQRHSHHRRHRQCPPRH